MDAQAIEKYLEEMGKGQHTRLFDMFALGPFMMWYAMKSGGKRGMGKWPRRALFVSGAMTVLYNWNNYRNIKSILEAKYKQVEDATQKVSDSLGGKTFLSPGGGDAKQV